VPIKTKDSIFNGDVLVLTCVVDQTTRAVDERWPRKTPFTRSNAENDNEIDITALLAQAEAIKDNPEAYLPESVEDRDLLAA